MTQLIAELESLEWEFGWDGRGGWNWIEPVISRDQQRQEELRELAARNWDAFCAAVESHLWRKDGTVR